MEEEPNLDSMLNAARAAQDTTDLLVQQGQDQAIAAANADLETTLQERDSLVDERRTAEDGRVEAVSLLEQGTELSAGSEVLAPETETFLRTAEQTVQQRQEQLAVAQERLATLDADPAVRNILYKEAVDEGRRIQLQADYDKCSYIQTQDGEHRGTLHNVFDAISPEYKSKVAGRYSNNDPLCQLEGFAFSSSGVWKSEKPKGTLDEAEDAVQRMTTIREEAETGSPDIKKIDDVLSEFLYKRLEHFFATLDQRVEVRAQQLADYYRDNPEAAAKYPNTPTTVEGWKQQLNTSMRNIGLKMEEASRTVQGEEFKARHLASIGEDVFQSASCGVGPGGDQYPFFPDDYVAKPDNNQAAA